MWVRYASCLRKLSQEPHIALIEQLNIVDPVLQHRDPLHAHAKGEAADLLCIVAVALDEFKDVRIDHAAAQQLDPSAHLAQTASLAAAFEARNRHIRARFCEREERREG